MRNIFLFIRRYAAFITFFFLQVLSLWFLFSYNRFHRAKFLGIANEFTGRINTQFNKVEDFFYLREENRRLNRVNDSLLNLQPANFMMRDTASQLHRDSVAYDTLGHYRRFVMRPGTVVYNTVNAQKNYIQINRGSNQGIKDKMGVVSSDGKVVGVVVNVSPNFSEAMSLLHVQNTISASLKKSGEFGTIEWDGKNPGFVMLKKIPKTVDVKVGDSVITSTVSFTFPPGFMVGTIAEVKSDQASGMYLLKVKTAVNFNNIQQVHIIENLERDEQMKLLDDTRRLNEEAKKSGQ